MHKKIEVRDTCEQKICNQILFVSLVQNMGTFFSSCAEKFVVDFVIF